MAGPAVRWGAAVGLGALWWWAVLRLLLSDDAGVLEGTVAAGGWGLSLLPVHCVPKSGKSGDEGRGGDDGGVGEAAAWDGRAGGPPSDGDVESGDVEWPAPGGTPADTPVGTSAEGGAEAETGPDVETGEPSAGVPGGAPPGRGPRAGSAGGGGTSFGASGGWPYGHGGEGLSTGDGGWPFGTAEETPPRPADDDAGPV
ncbi:hypothetical protein [Streptomyces mexicanus]|uniref:hypothetical protein n=1 Tax=Streptomyces mexicanus TaxID=178566 RepID=UPI00366194D9